MGIDRFGVFLAGWNDLLTTPVAAANGAAGAPTPVKLLDNGAGSNGVYAACFKRGDGINTLFQIPHGFVIGSLIYPHIHWMPTAQIAAAATVIWQIEYFWANLDGALPAATVIDPITYTAPVGNTAAGTMITTNFTAITSTGKTISSLLVMSITRITDTHVNAANCTLLGLDIHVNQTKLGTQAPTAQP